MSPQSSDNGSVVLLSSTQSIANAMTEMVRQPADIDRATELLGIPASLVNPALSSSVDLTFLGLGLAIHIPVQVSDRDGGRKSLYYLQPGERALTGFLATKDALISRYTTRESGNSMPAATGDEYSEELRGADGSVIAKLYGKLEIEDLSRGHGALTFSRGTPESVDKMVKDRPNLSWVWYFWSCIATGSARMTLAASDRTEQRSIGIRGDEPSR